MNSEVNQLRQSGQPQGATVVVKGGVTTIAIRVKFARWLKWTLAAFAIAVIGIVFAVAAIIPDDGACTPPRVVGVIALCVLAFALFMPVFIAMVLLQQESSARFNGKTLRLQEVASQAFDIPCELIRDLRVVVRRSRALHVWPERGPTELFSRAPAVALEIQLADGRLRFFKSLGPESLNWLVSELRRLLALPPARTVEVPPLVADATGVYGRDRRALLALGFIVTLAILLWAAWSIVPGTYSLLWPRTQGQVVHCRWEELHEPDARCVAEISYRYSVGGQTFTNDRIGFDRSPSDNTVRDLIGAHPEGSSIPVYFNPRHPAMSTVLPGFGAGAWVILGLAVVVSLMCAPLYLKCDSPALATLVSRYKVRPAGNLRHAAFGAAIRWTTPLQVHEDGMRARRSQRVIMFARTGIVCLAVVLVIRHDCAPLLPQFPWTAIVWLTPLIAGGAFLLDALTTKVSRPAEYAISDEGVILPLREPPLVRWDTIDSFTLKPHPRLPVFLQLFLHLKGGMTRQLPLPADPEVWDAVLAALRPHLMERPPNPWHAPLSMVDWMLGSAVTALYFVAVRYSVPCLGSDEHAVLSRLGVGILLIPLLAGPGTLTALLRIKRRSTLALIGLAAALNMVTFLMVMLTLLIRGAIFLRSTLPR